VQLMDVIDCLAPGLYEMVISPGRLTFPGTASSPATGQPASRPARSMTFARSAQQPDDDRAFAAVARLSELNLSTYRTFCNLGSRSSQSAGGRLGPSPEPT